jgi:hypothetical protein
MTQCVILACLYLCGLAFLGASFERYRHWLRTTEAVAGEPIRKVDRWTAYCRVKPWMRGCRPVRAVGYRAVSLVAVSSAGAMSAGNRNGLENGRGHF